MVQRDQLDVAGPRAGSLDLLLGHRRREQVSIHRADDQDGEQEDREVESLVDAGEQHLRGVDDDDRQRLADVFLHGVEGLQQIHRADGLDHEGSSDEPSHGVPIGEEAIVLDLRLKAEEHIGHHGPSCGHAGDLGRQRHVRKSFQVLLRQHRAIARHGDLNHHAKHGPQRQTPGGGTGGGAALVDNDKATRGDEHQQQHVPL
mmetsp:Transcript_101053/g.290017  ORF Transcript_101053/g.290017 Transcript_101053/m.290017 type:complete len:202 (-) Transcript_101053:124-729(-)